MNKDLPLPDGTNLAWFDKDYNRFLNKTTLIYGATQSGKSTIIDEIMYLCGPYISTVFVICQSSLTVSSSPYNGKIPDNCIKSNVTKEWLEEFMENQKGRAAIYKTANDMITLKSVYNKIKTSDTDRIINTILSSTEGRINQTNSNIKLNFAQKKEHIESINNIKNTELTKWYKKFIRNKKPSLEQFTNLSMDEKCCINYLDFNANVLLILDDCAASFKKWTKESNIIGEIFYNGRHSFITQIISAQDDKLIDSELRKNALATIFTTPQAATANFTRASNSYSKDTKKKAEICIKAIFENRHQSVRNYKKLVYINSMSITDPFAYTIAEIYEHFRIGCNALWALDGKINDLNKDSCGTNEFFNKYHNSH